MEDYDTFVRNRLSHRRNKEEERKKPASSAIRFYGAPILPPVLTDTLREEMQQHREAARKHATSQRLKGNRRLAYVQTILHNVQMRHSPTLEDLLQELKVTPKSLDTSNSSQSNQQSINTAAEINSPCIPQFSSTTNSAFFTSHVIPQPSHEGHRHVELGNQQAPEPNYFNSANHCSVPLGCMTHASMENNTILSECLDIRSAGHGPEETNNTTDFFLDTTSKTIVNTPDIISYPPIDGEELERSGQESSLCHDFITMNDSCSAVFPNDSIRSDHFLGDKSENSQMISAESQDNLSSSTALGMKEGKNIKQGVVPVPSSDRCHTSDIPELSQTPSIDSKFTNQLTQSIPGSPESVDTQVFRPQSQSSNRPSLQDLLRKSQEYREQQRLLRNQAKNARNQEKAQEKPCVEEKSLSDKENNEFHYKSTGARKTKEKRFVKTMNTTCKKANRDPERVSEQIILPHPQPLLQSQSPKVDYITADDATTDQLIYLQGHSTHHSIPVPYLCLSPVYNIASNSLPDGGGDNIRGKVLISSSYNESHQALEERNLGLQSDAPSVIVQSSQHMNQLESCLSSLKEVISDLGSSLLEIGEKWEDRPDEVNVEKHDQRNNEGPNRQSLDSCRNVLGNTDEQNSQDNSPSVFQDKEKEVVNLAELSLVNTFPLQEQINEAAFNMTSGHLEASRKQQSPAKRVLTVAKCMPIPDDCRNVISEATVPQDVSVLSGSNSHHSERAHELSMNVHSSTNVLSISQSLDGDTMSEDWPLEGSESEQDSGDYLVQANSLTPRNMAGIEGTSSEVKWRLLLHVTDNLDMIAAPSSEDLSEVKSSYSTCRVASPGNEHFAEEQKKVHAAQVRALQAEHKRRQEELRKPPCAPLEQCRPLLLAAVKGYLTRRLLKTERVAQVVRTIGDTQQFLRAFQLPIHKGEICNKQDLLLQHRVSLQLRAARYEIYDIFFCLSVAERMHLISLDRELARERVIRRQQMGHTNCPKGRSSLSAATQKSLLRKRGLLIQEKVSERHRGVVPTEHKTGFGSKQLREAKRGRLKTKPARTSQSWNSCRPR